MCIITLHILRAAGALLSARPLALCLGATPYRRACQYALLDGYRKVYDGPSSFYTVKFAETCNNINVLEK